ncbi:4997_t:CDS:1 [Dentiscutata heterogama]|uniref:4997_t:CDS:1 n=1 Tax=Dentiscutata heterogama TaxID=1316150 RepID=A0ACA9M5T7_9GLOM|nr:4997_t:CDS:1 [Dentiscutata heterogama]
MDIEELKLQISSVQAERERLELLLSQYMGDAVIAKEDRCVQSRKERLWKLANDLFNAFSLPDPKTHELFINTQELTREGFSNIFECYEKGIARLGAILRQDVYKTEARVTKGRRKRNVRVHKLAILPSQMSQRQNNRTENNESQQQDHENNNCIRRQRRITTNNEKEVLESILNYDAFPEDIAIETLHKLHDFSSEWDMQRIRTYWKNNRHNKRRKID